MRKKNGILVVLVRIWGKARQALLVGIGMTESAVESNLVYLLTVTICIPFV
jgi:hypothetical protein